MKILLTSSWFPTKNNPYNGDFVQRFAKALSQKANVTVLHIESHKNCKKKEVHRTVFNDNYTEILVYIPAVKPKILNTFRRMYEYQKHKKCLGNFDFIHGNVIYTDSLWLVFRKWFYKNPYFITEHFTNYDPKSGFVLPFWQKILAKMVAKNAQCVFPVSKSLELGMQNNGITAQYKVIPNIVDTELFCIQNSRNANNKTFRFLHVSSLHNEQKNISGILRVCKKLFDENINFLLILIGEDKKDYWKNYIVENQLESVVLLKGQLSHELVADFMKEADCLVLFSNYENQPCVIGEAFSCGLPIIATDVGGISEFFPEGFGKTITKGNEEELYEVMKKVVEQNQFPNKYLMHSYAVNTFSEEKIMNLYWQSYQEFLS